MKCFEEKDLALGKTAWKICKQKSITPYIRKECKHAMRNILCHEFESVTKDPSKLNPCYEMMEFNPKCGHSVFVKASIQDFLKAYPYFFSLVLHEAAI
jgi:hypothetical protein